MHDGLIEKGFQPVDSGLKLHHPTCGIMNIELKMLSTCRSENGVQMACILILISKFYIYRCLSYFSILTKFNCPSATFILRIDTKKFLFLASDRILYIYRCCGWARLDKSWGIGTREQHRRIHRTSGLQRGLCNVHRGYSEVWTNKGGYREILLICYRVINLNWQKLLSFYF